MLEIPIITPHPNSGSLNQNLRAGREELEFERAHHYIFMHDEVCEALGWGRFQTRLSFKIVWELFKNSDSEH